MPVAANTAKNAVPFASDPRIDETEWTIHAVCTATYACKHVFSRRTIPPALVLAASGFGVADGMTAAWTKMQDLRDGKKAKTFWKDGWAELGDGERWWEELSTSWEPERSRTVRAMHGAQQ